MTEPHRPLRTDVVPEISAATARAVATGVTLEFGPEDMFWGDRHARVLDPYGHRWSLATPGQGPGDAATMEADAQFEVQP